VPDHSVDESEEEYGNGWFDPEWLKPYETTGESVHLEESDKKSVNLALIQTRSDSPASSALSALTLADFSFENSFQSV
jgi:hypothetical protein